MEVQLTKLRLGTHWGNGVSELHDPKVDFPGDAENPHFHVASMLHGAAGKPQESAVNQGKRRHCLATRDHEVIGPIETYAIVNTRKKWCAQQDSNLWPSD
jgi:hypothetical protein